ncbi:DUF4351 domain-containing protein [Romeriopsis navalis]|uniref:DUF4351 domain-containing protein n=1 Tax=Romeriopsis navalis TaxID=2992132 RepID=UPI0021F8BEF4|nr:DUF4351 domain-containing protein [Romeriopsis navalis]
MLVSELKQTRFYQDVFAEGAQQGFAEGNANLGLKQLHHRFGALPETVLDRVSALSVEQLEALGELLLDWRRVEELTDWLGRQM